MTTLSDRTSLSDPLTLARPGHAQASGATAWLRATRAEMRRLLRPSFAGIGALLLALFAVMATTVAFAADVQGPGFATSVDLDSSRGLVAGLAAASSLMGIVVLAMWAVAAASDYGTGWIRVMVQAEPRRWALLAGKLVTLTLMTLVGALIATVVSVALAPVVAQGAGVVTDAWWTDAPATILSAWASLSLALLAWGVVGFAIATLTRSSVVAIAGGIGYLMVFEGLLRVLAVDATTYLPGSVLSAVAAGGTPDLAWGTSVALAVVYVVIGIAVSAIAFIRRDITA